jgi:hypothetical protein
LFKNSSTDSDIEPAYPQDLPTAPTKKSTRLDGASNMLKTAANSISRHFLRRSIF